MDYLALKAELLAGHPGTGAYNVSDQLAADQLNAVNRTKNLTLITGDEAFGATVGSEFTALTDHKRLLWLSFCGKDINPFSAANVALVTWLFGGGSATLAALAALRTTNISRAAEIAADIDYSGLISVSHVTTARAS